MHFTAYLPRMENELAVTSKSESQPSTINNNNNNTTSISPITTHANQSVTVIPTSEYCQQQQQPHQEEEQKNPTTMPIVTIQHPLQRKSLSMCFTSTGATLSLPPKKKDIYRPYSLDDKPTQRPYGLRIPREEDLHAAHNLIRLSESKWYVNNFRRISSVFSSHLSHIKMLWIKKASEGKKYLNYF